MDRRDFLKQFGTIVFLPFVATPRRNRKWYVAQDMGTGTIVDPYTLSEALASDSIKPGDTVYLRGGVYRKPDSPTQMVLPGGTAESSITWRAYEGERPVITREDGGPPYVAFGQNAIIDSIWFGGAKENEHVVSANALSNVTVRNCTFFGYYGCFSEGGHVRNQYIGNRFVNCNGGGLYHDFYISNFNAEPGEGAVIAENIHMGGTAYQIHLWHEPKYCTVRHNFCGNAQHAFVLNGVPHEAYGNIFWSARGFELGRLGINLSSRAGNIYRDNFHGPLPSAGGFVDDWFGGLWPASYVQLDDHRGNHYYDGDQRCDENATVLQPGDEVTHLGNSRANIDAAISTIEASFATQTVAQIQADETIETHFATLKAVIDTWKANTV